MFGAYIYISFVSIRQTLYVLLLAQFAQNGEKV